MQIVVGQAVRVTAIRQLARTTLLTLGTVPPLRPALRAGFSWRFRRATRTMRGFGGLYPDFAAARRDVPSCRANGFDDESTVGLLLDEADTVFSSDYAMMFWFAKFQDDLDLVFDWGGYLGRSYRIYRRLVGFDDRLRWVINDVPAVVRFGRSAAASMFGDAVSFTESFDALEQADLLLASGSFQVIEDPWQPLQQAARRPRHVLIDKIPAYDQPSAVTLHSVGTALVPYHLFNKESFVSRFRSMGYELIDTWLNHNVDCRIPFYEDHSIAAYSGFYFRFPH
ncbi:methyltransferase, TIGR04325 family [Paracraurococcus lichenis]|uniref:Methyltransferase, TIGR04325 family n=1 Tax=Paracraurococcus lichenis TaxID=3064888 RepID=A0ABT9E934_9PROT|nr:methyltransferase, TIGR04325 family [Paracraurococcus sp. LOR1-02]MDO9712580.1 methyltransferase, TIGR04325 family [Paracraurococcus sp. LOR1-02]